MPQSTRKYATAVSVLILIAAAAYGLKTYWWDVQPNQAFSSSEIDAVSFNEHIRPIFNSKCVACHGGVTKQGGISYIFRDEALKRGNSGRRNVVPGKPRQSELIARVNSDDPLLRMPFAKDPLSEKEKSLLSRWIEQGAQWEEHWAFVTPEQVPEKEQSFKDWSDHPVDAFVGAMLTQVGLEPAAEAPKEKLLRRVSLDLTGLPPTPAEVEEFKNDQTADAYERQIDRLLASPRFGEKWASMWLDLARYADSMGYVRDLKRDSWPYRDWVIQAYNDNLPYDEFIKLQLAGDLIDGAGLDGLIASSFHRQTPTNVEGGSDNEEYRMVAVMDRVATTWSVLNGVTMECVQCHSHPYDPIMHEDYYASLAFFNGSSDYDLNSDTPKVRIPFESDQRHAIYQIEQEKDQLVAEFIELYKRIDESASWVKTDVVSASANEKDGWRRRLSLIEALMQEQEDQVLTDDEGANALAAGKIMKLAEDARNQISLPENNIVEARTLENGEARFPVDVSPVAQYRIVANSVDTDITMFRLRAAPTNLKKSLHTPESGFAIEEVNVSVLRGGQTEEVVAVRALLADGRDSIEQQQANNYARALQGSSVVSGFSTEKLRYPQSVIIVPQTPIRLAPEDRLVFRLTQAQLIRKRNPAPVLRNLNVEFSNSPLGQWGDVNPQVELITQLDALEAKLEAMPGADLPIMKELPASVQPETLMFERGDMLAKTGNALTGDVPDIFSSIDENDARDRKALAKWFVSNDQPLTSRVAVNRYWEQLFGLGLVETLEDFGSAGTAPSHPELLDWLAWQFQHELNWDRKALIRQIVTSKTYRQSSACAAKSREVDPQNRYLSCGARQRLTAEMVRDQALFASGLMANKLGGPPVMPPQPDGIWNSAQSAAKWEESSDSARYRRAIYTYFKQSTPYPSFIIFDHASRDVSTARRIPTSTPLQALVTLNDPVFIEAGHALAKTMEQAANLNKSRLNGYTIGYQRVISREPKENEVLVLDRAFDNVVAEVNDPMNGWRAVAAILLNTDEALTR